MDMEKMILVQQRNELTEHYIYAKLAGISRSEENRKILERIAQDELRHYGIWKSVTKQESKPSRFKIFLYVLLARTLGLSFSLKLMEGGEGNAARFYSEAAKTYPQAVQIRKEENEHEGELIGILHDSRLAYAGAIVLGLNDALVELTGTLAGLSFAFGKPSLVGVTGLIMGIAASLSMAASGYLSSQEGEGNENNPITAAIYTGIAYLVTVAFLVAPFFLFTNVYVCLGVMLAAALGIILAYTFYISVAKGLSFRKRFLQMAGISLGVAVFSFGVGWAVRRFVGVDL